MIHLWLLRFQSPFCSTLSYINRIKELGRKGNSLDSTQTDKGIARTQSPTNKNCAFELPTFGVIVGVSLAEVQWKGLALEEPPSWSRLTSTPGKYELSAALSKQYRHWNNFPFDQTQIITFSQIILSCYWQSYKLTALLYYQLQFGPSDGLSSLYRPGRSPRHLVTVLLSIE